jgi:urease accessory protein UreH/RNAse (barnase) inhibitor barstar
MALARYIIRRAHTASYSTSSSILQSALPLPSESTTHSTCAKNRGSKHNNHHQNGYGKIVAVSSAPSSGLSTTVHTYFTELRHSSPMRLVPSRRTHPTSYNMQNRHENEASNRSHRCEGALVHLSSYGGGLVPGDKLTLDIDVRGKGAMLAVMTQGGQRIYRPGEHFRMYENYKHGIRRTSETSARSKPNSELDTSKVCQSTINCSISPGATLFYLPDPTVPYRSSSFEERRVFNCQFASAASDSSNNNHGSLIAVDWYSSGRTYSADIEERWAFDYLATRTELYITDVSNTCTQELVRPNLIESMSFGNKGASDRSPPAATSMGQSFDAMATLLLHGPTSTPVAKRAMELERKLAGSLTRIRRDDSDSEERTNGNIDGLDQLLDSLGGQVLLSVTQVEHDIVKQQQQLHNNNTHMVRILAENNEDIYRALNYCLKECSVHFGGLEPYKERIHSSKTVREKNIPLSMQQQKERRQNKGDDLQAIVDQLCLFPVRNSNSNSNNAWFRVCTLSDCENFFVCEFALVLFPFR